MTGLLKVRNTPHSRGPADLHRNFLRAGTPSTRLQKFSSHVLGYKVCQCGLASTKITKYCQLNLSTLSPPFRNKFQCRNPVFREICFQIRVYKPVLTFPVFFLPIIKLRNQFLYVILYQKQLS
jgi:hypothetical protein